MPEKIKSVTVYTESQVYRPGDVVKGHWIITSEKEFDTKGILSTFQGVAFVKWTETSFSKKYEDDEFISYEVYTKETKLVHGNGEAKVSVQPGVYKFPFSYRLPQRSIPSSYEGSKGAVRYYITLLIRRPLPFPDVIRYKNITVLENIDVNNEQFKMPLAYKKNCQIPKALWLGNAGTVDLWGRIDRRAYCPGEKIALSVIAKNNSTQKLGKIKAQVMQYVTYIGNAKENYSNSTLKVVQASKELESGNVFKWTNTLIQLDGVPATINRPTCQCIRVRYYVEVIVPVPFFTGSDLKLVFPITIGTVPLGKSLTSTATRQNTAGVQVYDASKAITYTACNKGWSVFRQSSTSRNFPIMTYTPMCAYAVNYEFRNTSNAAIQTLNTATSTSTPKATPKTTSKSSSQQTLPSPASSLTPSAPSLMPASAPPPYLASSNVTQEMTSDISGAIGHASAKTSPPSSTSVYVNKTNQMEQEESDLPPSYEEAIGVQESAADENSDEEESDVWYVVVRLPKNLTGEFVTFVRNNKKLLEVHEGRFIFKSVKTYNSKGNWPKGRDVAMLSFPSKKQAVDWFSAIRPDDEGSKWLVSADIAVTGAKEQYQSGKSAVTFYEALAIEEEAEALKRYRDLLDNILRPLRHIHGGQLFVWSTRFEVIKGTWRSSDHSKFGMMAWSDLESARKYKSSISELQKTIDELKAKCMVVYNSASYEVQDMSEEQPPLL